jgi:putative MATE family efflux protein
MRKILPVEKEFFPYLVKLALPIAVQNILQVSLSVTDIFMISRYNAEIGVASISLAAQVFANIMLVFFGFGSGSAVFFSRYWGAKNFHGLRETLGLALFSTALIGITGAVLFGLHNTAIMSLMTHDPLIVKNGADYLRITAFSFPFVALSVIIASYLRSVEKSHYPMWISFSVFFINVFLNYVFIFGKFGMPAMGIKGAALTTLIARILDASLHFAVFMSAKNPVTSHFRDYFSFLSDKNRKKFLKGFFKVTIPVVLGDATWALAITAYKKAYALSGTDTVAAFAAVDSFYQIFFVLFIGLGSAAGIIMGASIGRHDLERTHLLAKVFLRLNFIFAIPIGLIMMALAPFVAGWYDFDGQTARYIHQATLICGLFLSFRSLEFFLTVGILRAGGDTNFYLIAQTVTLWLIGVPAAFAAVHFFNAPGPVLYFIVVIEEVVRDIVCYLRLRSNRWIKKF